MNCSTPSLSDSWFRNQSPVGTAAIMNGSIDFLYYPEFDFPTMFAALLYEDQGGRFEIEPCLAGARIRQLYLPDTNILLTRFRLRKEWSSRRSTWRSSRTQHNQMSHPNVPVIRGNVCYANRLGLYSEQLGANGQHLGNCPTHSHLWLRSVPQPTWAGLSRKRGRVYGARCVK